MKHRSVIVEEAKTLSDTGLASIDIKPGAPISAIEMIFGGTKGATENQSDKIQAYVTLIELLDGGNVIASVSMAELVAMNAFERGAFPAHDYDLGAGGTAQESCWLNFGRFLFDPDYYLDPGNYRNLQLKVTTALTAAAGTYVTATLTVDVICHVMDEGAGAYQGFFAPKTVKTWTTLASGVETIDMPQDYKYDLVIMGAGEDNIALATDVTDWKMTCDADKHIVFDFDTADLILRNRAEFGPFDVFMQSNMQDADVLDAPLWDIVGVGIQGGDEDFTTRCEGVTGNRMTFCASDQT